MQVLEPCEDEIRHSPISGIKQGQLLSWSCRGGSLEKFLSGTHNCRDSNRSQHGLRFQGSPLSDLVTNFSTQMKTSDGAGTKVAERNCGLRRDDLGGMGRRKQPGAKGWCHKVDALGCL